MKEGFPIRTRLTHRLALRLLLVAFLLPVLGRAQSHEYADQPPGMAGLGVFGSVLGLHGSDTLTVRGDLVLDRADVVGDGVLSMQGKKPARLVARHSRLAHLHIRAEKGVTLQGDLRIERSLTIETGILDVRTATMILGTQAQLRLLPTGKLLNPAMNTQLTRQPGPTSRPPDQLAVWAMLAPDTLHWAGRLHENRSMGELTIRVPGPLADESTPPPEPIGGY